MHETEVLARFQQQNGFCKHLKTSVLFHDHVRFVEREVLKIWPDARHSCARTSESHSWIMSFRVDFTSLSLAAQLRQGTLETRTLLWFGHGCTGNRRLSKHERYYGLGMDGLVDMVSELSGKAENYEEVLKTVKQSPNRQALCAHVTN